MLNEQSKEKIIINPHKIFVGAFVPNWLLCRNEISHGAKLVYARLCQYAGRRGIAFPKQDTLAEEVGIKTRQVREYLTELKTAELIFITRPKAPKENEYASYGFYGHEWMWEKNSYMRKSAGMENLNRQKKVISNGRKSVTPILEENHNEENHTIIEDSGENYFKKIDEFFKNPDQAWLNEIKAIYSKISLAEELAKMRAWLISNPEKQKKNIKRFVVNWLNNTKIERPISLSKTSGKSWVPVTDAFLNERLGKIATREQIKAVLREIPQNAWCRVDQFLRRRYPISNGAGFAEAERELSAEIKNNREQFSALAESLAGSKSAKK